MILLHVMVVALYGLTAYALWPATAGHGPASRGADRIPAGAVAWLVPAALLLHAFIGWHDIATPEGLDLSFVNAVSVVAGLVAAVAWSRDSWRRCLPSAPSCCPWQPSLRCCRR
jgi:ABC-type uncharacterized transport system permease subunit